MKESQFQQRGDEEVTTGGVSGGKGGKRGNTCDDSYS